MKAMEPGRPTRLYDLPATRILSRALRYSRQVSRSLMESDTGLGSEAAEDISARLVSDLVFLRLAELRGILPDHTTRDIFSSDDSWASDMASIFSLINRKSGLELFDAGLYGSITLPPEPAREFIRELGSKRFFPVDMPEELLGALLEVLPYGSISFGHSNRRMSGSFYTPARIVNKVLDEALPLLLPTGSLMPVSLYILDPSCGSGNFLVGAYRKLLLHEERYLASRPSGLFYPLIRLADGSRALEWPLRQKILKRHIFGVDLDSSALNAACRGLLLVALRGFPLLDETPPSLEFLDANLRQGDSLVEHKLAQQAELFTPELPKPLAPFRWDDAESGFGDILSDGGFHAVVGNPPWLSLKGRHKMPAYTPEVVNYLLDRYHANTYRPNLFEIFIRRALDLLREGGINSFVVPDRMAMNLQFEDLRKHLVSHGDMLRLHFREPFPGVVADTLIYVFRKTSRPHKRQKLLLTDASGMQREAPQHSFVKQASFNLMLSSEQDISGLLRKIERAGSRPVRDFFSTGVGFIARPGRINVERETPEQRIVIKGENVFPYGRRGGFYFKFDDRNLAGGTKRLDKLTSPARILVRKTGPRLVAAIDKTGDLPEQSLYFLNFLPRRLCKPYDLRYFLGLLNSSLLTFYYRHKLITNPASTPQLKKVHLDMLPTRPIRFGDAKDRDLHDRLARLVGEREADASSDSTLDAGIDDLVYELYGLTAEERHLVDSLSSRS